MRGRCIQELFERQDMREFALRAARMFDGFRMRGPVTVQVGNGRIMRIDSGLGLRADDPGVIDLGPDSCLLPGLVDTHVHLAFNASADPVSALSTMDDEKLLATMGDSAHLAVQAGMTTVRDLGDRGYLSEVLNGRLMRQPESGPEIVYAGAPITTPDGHCFFLGGEVADREALLAAVRERQSHGCAVVKIMVSGGTMTPGSPPPYESQFSRAEVAMAVAEAHRLGMRVAAHAHGTEAIRDAVAAGVDTIEHASFMTENGSHVDAGLVREIVDRDVFVSLTLGFHPAAGVPDLPPAVAARMAAIRHAYLVLYDAGAKLVLGTDAGIAPFKPHDVLPYAIEQLADLGVAPADALSAATSGAAEACGAEDRKGRIVEGADADFLVVPGDPLTDLSVLQKPSAVFRAGVRVR